jgi:hypothetical protein
VPAQAKNGGYADDPKLASAKLEGMTTAEIGRFLVACALASDLYFPSYLSSATLPKGSTLAKEAAHYKVNTRRILQEVRGGLAKKSRKEKNHSKPQSTATPKR